MKRNLPGSSFLAPWLLWNELAVKTAELMFASAQVIAHRTGRMAIAGAAPNVRDRREFALMGREKIEAGAKSARAMAAHMMALRAPLGGQVFRDIQRSTAAFKSLATSRTPAQVIARQAALASALGRSASSMADATKSVTRLAQRGLKPIHAKATANAKRLRNDWTKPAPRTG